ncbi:MAG TPA: pitrilysin family protein [Acidimicrobiales bacterium]|nr:pitrilysin family protein [Acidimicrobiales bacterium]
MPDSIRDTRLDNGMQVVTDTMPDAHSVTIGFWVDAGSRDETLPEAGASHFLEHLLFKGTETRSAHSIAEDIEAVGGDMNAFTTKEYTAFYTRLIDEDLDLGLDILSEIMWAPAFRPEEIEAERQVILEEINMHEDEPSDLVHELLHEALYPGHPLGREVLGERSTITAMTRDQIDGYFTTRYKPPSIVVAASGNLDHDNVVAGIERRFTGRTGTAPARERPALAPVRPLIVQHRTTEQAHLVVGMRSLDRHDEDRFTLSVLNQILGGGMSSRLFQEIREKRGLVYSVFSYRAAYLESGALAVYAGTAPGRAQEVLGLIDDELDKLASGPVTDRELAVAKGHIKGSLALSLEDSAGRMNRIGRGQLIHGEVLSYEEVVARTEAVTHDDLRRVADRILANERVLAVVGPFSEDDFAARVA